MFVFFLPILLFVTLFAGSGIYFTAMGVDHAFYQVSPLSAILPAIGLAGCLQRGKIAERVHIFLEGARHPDIIAMCMIFLLSGAFSAVTKSIGSVDATVQWALALVPSQFLLPSLFLIAAFISTAIGTSLGTIATIAPIVATLSHSYTVFPMELGMGTIVGGAMFGDNLSIVSDTTIAAVLSQEADMKAKLKFNAKIVAVPAFLTALILWGSSGGSAQLTPHTGSLFLVSPYILLIVLAASGLNVFIALSVSLLFAGGAGMMASGYSLVPFSKDIANGFTSMHEILILSLLVGGLSAFSRPAFKEFAERLSSWIAGKNNAPKLAQLVIAKIVSVLDILIANNTIAIIFSGEMARMLAKKYHIPPHYSAAWLGIFSCVWQGLIPYGAQVLLASSMGGISPLSIVPFVYYCYLLGLFAVIYILITPIEGRGVDNE